MKNILRLIAIGLASVALVLLSCWGGREFGIAKFVDNFSTQATNLIVSLTIIAAIVERSVAIFNTVLFGDERRQAEVEVQGASAKIAALDAARRQDDDLTVRLVRENPNPALVQTLTSKLPTPIQATAVANVHVAHQDALAKVAVVAQKEDTLRVWVGLLVCTFVAIVGVRTLGSLMQPTGHQAFFNAVDIIVTAGLLAGGSQGIAQIADVISKVLAAAKAKTGQG